MLTFSDAPPLVPLKELYYNTTCYIVARAKHHDVYHRHPSRDTVLLAWEKDKYLYSIDGDDIYHCKAPNDIYWRDTQYYRDTVLYLEPSEIIQRFFRTKWIICGDSRIPWNCELIIEYKDQKCISCGVSAPHQQPNKLNGFICELCKVAESISEQLLLTTR